MEAVDGRALRQWALTCVRGLETRCDEINDLNVFPIPDSDTGTNLLLTMRSAVDALAELGAGECTARHVAAALARGAFAGARGNSGIILSQVLRGVAEVAVADTVDAATLRGALGEASALAASALSDPREGTVVTVLRAAAVAALGCRDGAGLAEVARTAADAAAEELARTPSQLDVLAAAGVVDAGGLGLVVILDALAAVITGAEPTAGDDRCGPPMRRRAADPAGNRSGAEPGVHGSGGRDVDGAPDFEVMYHVTDTAAERVADLRTRLEALGDSVAIVGDGTGRWSVHVHCDDAGAAVEAGLAAGRLHRVRIGCFALDALAHPPGGGARGEKQFPSGRAVLALVAGDGAAELFSSEGAIVLRCDTPVTRRRLLAAIRGIDRREVLVLSNGALTAQELVAVGAAARDSSHDVTFLPSSSMVQGLASLAVHDPNRMVADDGFAMSEAAAATRWGSLRIARERALTWVGTCEPGDGLGLFGHDVVVIEPDIVTAGRELIDKALAAGGELVTLLLGAEAPEGLDDQLTEHIAVHHPGLEVVVYHGGQHSDLLQLGVE